MEVIIGHLVETLKMAVVAGAALAGTWMVYRQMLKKEEIKAENEVKLKKMAEILPLRISAYERLVLFLERSYIPNLIARIDPHNKTVAQFRYQVVSEVNMEFEHNVVMQLYISPMAWQNVVKARAEVVHLFQEESKNMADHAPALELANAVLKAIKEKPTGVLESIDVLKKELANVFFT